MNFNVKENWQYVLGGLGVVIVGVLTAWLISGKLMKTSSSAVPGVKITSTEAGILNPDTKYATAEGVLTEGGTENEGTHHLVRDGGPSQTVYLTSSVIDLQSFAGKKVQIWGETLSSKKAGWLMDVVKVKVI